MKKTKENKKYWFENYKPTKNAVAVDYNGTHYLSKAQCMALEGITRKELDEYLSNPVEENEILPEEAEIIVIEGPEELIGD